jgi:hypothetical protein
VVVQALQAQDHQEDLVVEEVTMLVLLEEQEIVLQQVHHKVIMVEAEEIHMGEVEEALVLLVVMLDL